MVTEKTSKSEATRERILETALALFAEAGFVNTTMRQIAAEAGCSLGLAYRYFETKDDMVVALYVQMTDEFIDDAAKLANGTLSERWSITMKKSLARMEPYRKALTGLTGAGTAIGKSTQVLGEEATNVRRQMLAAWREIISGSTDAPKPAMSESLSRLFYSLYLLTIFFWIQDPSPEQRVTKALIQFGEDHLKRMRLILKLRWVGDAVMRLSSILEPVLHGNSSSN